MSKLINPYIVVIQQDEVLETYRLKRIKIVNAEAKENVINKESNPHYLGCYADLKRSICNRITTKETPIKYSEGFCCSCNMATNIERQLHDCQGRSRFKHVIHTRNNYKDKFEIIINQIVDNITLDSDEVYDKRSSSTNQIRGGQNCENLKTPKYIDEPYRYHESSHCLQFSDLWYNINKLESASYYHSVTISVYEKYSKNDKPAYKKIISKVKLSTKNKNYKNKDSTMQTNFVALTFGDNQYYSLDVDRDRLLIPRKVPPIVEHQYPQAMTPKSI
uniref:Generative cell specific-1/HAP2 domain-containing protein n=1 Tax=Sipha flava TaxID=143950 RepID=A0A2S2Q980_9HEMI